MSDLLDVLMGEVLAKMSVISEQQAHSYDIASVHGGERDNLPAPLIDKPLIAFYRDHYNRAESRAVRRRVLLEAVEALKIARRMPLGAEPQSTSDPRWKRWVAETDTPVADIVRRFSVTRQYVHRIRRAYRDAA